MRFAAASVVAGVTLRRFPPPHFAALSICDRRLQQLQLSLQVGYPHFGAVLGPAPPVPTYLPGF
eukprot:10278580-Prorocentrum_lima.AAC.1